MHARRRNLIRPLDAPTVRAGSGESKRVLLVGNGLFHGWGVASHQLAPTGELARGIRTITGSSCEVEFVGDATMDAASALAWLADRADTSFHVAVVAIGSNDALRLTPVSDWGVHLVALVDAVQGGLPDGTPVVLVGIPDVFVPDKVRAVNPMVMRHARRLDRVTERLAEMRQDVWYLPGAHLTGLAGSRPDSDLYAAFTTPIAAMVAHALRFSSATATEAVPERFDRDEVRTIIEAARWDENSALHEVVKRAKERFGTAEAAVTLLDGDRTWHVANNGSTPNAVPRALSYCQTVVTTEEPLIVADAKKDPRFASNPLLNLVHAPFYAGFPIHAADGTTIGSFCLLHGMPRAESSVDLDALAEFAREAEAVIASTVAARTEQHQETLVR